MIRSFIKKNERKVYRFLEIIPGLFSWSLILFPIWGSFLIPKIVAYYIISFDVYWFYRSTSIAFLALVAHFKIKASQKFDWLGEVKFFYDWRKIHHIIIIPTYKEPLATLRRTLNGLVKQTFPKKRIIIVLAFEQREGRSIKEKAKILKSEFAKKFCLFYVTFHPANIPGEVAGKSSNVAWAAKFIKKKLIDEKKFNLNHLVVTNEDADALLHPNYLAALTFKFLDDPNRFRKIFQPAIQFYNNIWRVPAITRVFNITASVVQTGLLMRKDRLINFSTYSTSFKMVVDVGYWDTDVIPEDYRFFFKCFFKFGGNVEVEPIFLPVFADAAESTTFLKTIINQYEQIKRWAWGVSDDAYIIQNWLTAKKVPFWEKTIRALKVIEDHFLWPVNWFAITLGAAIPPILNKDFARTILGKTLPQISSAILTLSLISIIIIVYIDLKQRPKAPAYVSTLKKIIAPFELVLLPIVGFLFTALPGLDAHTRLMLGKYIEYRVTEKV